MRVFFCCILLHSLAFSEKNQAAKNKQNIQELSQNPYWLKLIHYQNKSKSKKLSKKYKSEADGHGFFMSKQGMFSPIKELSKNIDVFNDDLKFNKALNQYGFCTFPLRFSWLYQNNVLDKNPKTTANTKSAYQIIQKHCPKLHQWKNRLAANGAVLVYAGSYLNNPASMFGHTFLRFTRIKQGQQTPAHLDYVINFEANTGDDNPLAYTIKGLFGFYPGTFSAFPYHFKINQYVRQESRDLWEYPLNVNQAQIDQLVLHLWELSNTYYAYYFVDKNCSYYLLSLLEIIHPNFSLRDNLPFFTAPVDTLKAVKKHTTWNDQATHRPSSSQILKARLELLNSKQKKRIQTLYKTQNIQSIQNLKNTSDNINFLDALVAYADYKNKEPKPSQFQKNLWLLRSKYTQNNSKLNIRFSKDPSLSHASRKMGLSYSNINQKNFVNLHYRGAFHDHLDSLLGIPNLSHIEALKFKLSFSINDRKVLIPDFTFINIESINPIESLFVSPSWMMDIGAKNTRLNACINCTNIFTKIGPGISFGSYTKKRFLIFSYLNANFRWAPWHKSLDTSLGFSSDTGLLLDSSKKSSHKIVFSNEFNALKNFKHLYLIKSEHSFHFNQRHSLRLSYDRNKFYNHFAFGYFHFF